MANQLVQAWVDKEIKEESAAVLAAMGLTVSDAGRLLLTRVARERELPFAPLDPNAETIAAIEGSRELEICRSSTMSRAFSMTSMRTIERTRRFKRDYKRECRIRTHRLVRIGSHTELGP